MLVTVTIYSYDRTVDGHIPYEETMSPVRIRVATVPVPYPSRIPYTALGARERASEFGAKL